MARLMVAAGAALLMATSFAVPARADAGNPASQGAAEAKAQVAGPSYWTWRNAKSGKCMATENGSTADGTAIIQWPCNGNPDQGWSEVRLDVQVYQQLRSQADPSKCLAVRNADQNWGARLILWTCNGNHDQFWAVMRAPNGGYLICNMNTVHWKYAPLGLVAAVLNGVNDDRAPLIQWQDNGNDDQRWY